LTTPKRSRSSLPRSEARQRYLEVGSQAVLEQIRLDSEALDASAIAIGPFSRLDSGRVAARVGKTRGVISNLFGSQSAYQVATMEMVLDAGSDIESIVYPAPADFATPSAWIDAFLLGQAARGPVHGAPPESGYAFLWTLWLAALPYGLWSNRIARPSMDEYNHWCAQIEAVIEQALAHFGLTLRPDVTARDVAGALGSLVEGVWLNQMLTETHPARPEEPITALLLRSGRLVWQGALVQSG
jgi:hypothetical protein